MRKVLLQTSLNCNEWFIILLLLTDITEADSMTVLLRYYFREHLRDKRWDRYVMIACEWQLYFDAFTLSFANDEHVNALRNIVLDYIIQESKNIYFMGFTLIKYGINGIK